MNDGWIPKDTSVRQVSAMLHGFFVFMDEVAGKDSESRPFVKIPRSIFEERVFGGPLSQLIWILVSYKEEHQWRRFDFTSSSKLSVNIALVQHALRKLEESGALVWPSVYFSDEISAKDKRKYEKIVTTFKGKIARSEADATYVVVPNSPEVVALKDDEEEEDAEGYLRALRIHSNLVRVHWWYYPDSYDEWIPSSEVDRLVLEEKAAETETQKERDQLWKNTNHKALVVQERFISDLAKFKEWMNAEDYFLGDEHSGSEDAQRDDLSPQSRPSKNSSKPMKGKKRSAPTDGKDDRPGKVVLKWNRSKTSDVSKGGLTPLGKKVNTSTPLVPRSSRPKESDTFVDGARISSVRHGDISRDSDTDSDESVLEPTRASSGKPVSIPPKPSLADFAVDVHVPSHALWFDLTKVHSLEKGTFPEYFAKAPHHPHFTSLNYMHWRNFIVLTYRAHPRVYLSLTACRRLCPFDVGSLFKLHSFLEHWGLINFRRDPASEPLAVGPSSRPGLTTNLLPQSITVENPDLTALSNALVPAYRRLNPASEASLRCYAGVETGAKWTISERIRLVEALDEHRGNWDAVESYVGTKTKEQCLLEFLRLPILHDILAGSAESHLSCGSKIEALAASSPLIAQLAALADGVDFEELKNVKNTDILDGDDSGASGVIRKGLIAAALKAKLAADEEASSLKLLAVQLIQVYGQKIDAKLRYIESLERVFESEKRNLFEDLYS